MSFRKEIKFKLSLSEHYIIKNELLLKGMTSAYPARKINSYYFDNKDLKLFEDSEEGIVPRKKVRVRWYNNENDFKKETKISSVEGRFKKVKKLTSIKSQNDIHDLTFFDEYYGLLYPTILVNYEREYFKIDKLRITFDKNINYFSSKLKSKISSVDKETVVEIKTPIDCSDDYIAKFVDMPTSRFSKYSRGLLHLKRIVKL